MRIAIAFVVLAAVAILGYVRLAPSDPERWHLAVEGTGDADFASGALRVVQGDQELLAKADEYMRALPRTTVLAGSAAEGRITYVTRSAVIGFPDYTTLEFEDGTLKMLARLRFGSSDLGVNRKRLEGVLSVLKGG